MNESYESGEFEHKGRTYRYALHFDNDIGPPWKEHDGHGPVSERHMEYSKSPGEWVLHSDRWGKRYYDFQEATKIAKRDGWGLGKEDEAKLAQRLGRAPTRKEIVREAVIRDFEYLRGWCSDDWHWCWMEVSQEDTEETATLSGLQSDDDSYLEAVKHDLADDIADQLDRDMAAEIAASRPDMQPGFHL